MKFRKRLISIMLILSIISILPTFSGADDTDNSASSETTFADTTSVDTTSAGTTSTDTTSADSVSADSGFSIDDHKYAPILLEIFGQRIIDETCETIDAFMAGESSVIWEEYQSGDMPDVCRCLSVMCPLFSGFAYVANDCIDDAAGRFYWTNCCTLEELAEHKAALDEAVTAFLSAIESNDSDLVKAVNLYYNFNSRNTYDWAAYDSSVYEASSIAQRAYASSTYAAIVNHSAVCYGFSNGLTYLYIQAGLNAVPVGCDVSEYGYEGHAWVMLKLDGKYYYVDPTWDIPNDNEYAGLHYFGMTEQDRYDSGGYTYASTQLFGNVWKVSISNYEIEDQRFSMFRDECFAQVVSIETDHEQQRLIIHTADGGEHILQSN